MIFSPSILLAQQPYAGKATLTKCDGTENTSSSVLGYICNGQNPSCQAYLIYISQSKYDTVSSISKLLASDPSQLSQINSVPENASFQVGTEVIVPVNCSCSARYYQASSSYSVVHEDTRYLIATSIYQGLVSCLAVRFHSNYSRFLYTGMNISIPLRCACPTTKQSNQGVKYLLTYLVKSGDDVSNISRRFGADVLRTLDANEQSENAPMIYEKSTLLIPLQNPPSASQTIKPPVPPPTPPPIPPPALGESRKGWIYAVIGASVAGFCSVFIIAACIRFLGAKGKANPTTVPNKRIHKLEIPLEELVAGVSDINNAVKVYEFEELQLATENFSDDCKIKGSVYHGLVMGDAVAIKEVDRNVSKEINILKMVNHFNLIRLLGVCCHDSHSYLVYEYAENGPLSDWIFDKIRSKVLSWVLRMQILFDVANGLNYLHVYTKPAHVHMAIASRNVLLNHDFRAKIANFATARYNTAQEGQLAVTKHIIGTKGYMAPEFLELGLVSPELDVYAYGVLMLEIISGKAAVISSGDRDLFLSHAFLTFIREENAEEKVNDFMDPSLDGKYPLELAMMIARLSERCLSKDLVSRPSMDEIVQSLSKILAASLSWEFSDTSLEIDGSYRSPKHN